MKSEQRLVIDVACFHVEQQLMTVHVILTDYSIR